MKIILIQGGEDTGKTTLCNKLDEWLLQEEQNYQRTVYEEDTPKKPKHKKLKDFRVVYEKEGKKVLMNTLADDQNVIQQFEDFLAQNQQDVDMLITTIRPPKDNLSTLIKQVYGSKEEDILVDMEKNLKVVTDKIIEVLHTIENL